MSEREDDYGFQRWHQPAGRVGPTLTGGCTMGHAGEAVHAQIEQLAAFIIAEIPGKPSQSEGTVDTAIRIMGQQRDRLAAAERDNTQLLLANEHWHMRMRQTATSREAEAEAAQAQVTVEHAERIAAAEARGWQQGRDAALREIPANWTDALLTGGEKALQGAGGTWGCPDIERLLIALGNRIASIPPPEAAP